MFSVFLKPLLGLLTIGGLGTGGYFLYKNIQSKKSEKVSEEITVNSGSKGVVDSNSGGGGSDGPAVPNLVESRQESEQQQVLGDGGTQVPQKGP